MTVKVNRDHRQNETTVPSDWAKIQLLCHVIVELLAVGPSLLLIRRRGTPYLTIYVICHVAIGLVILGVS